MKLNTSVFGFPVTLRPTALISGALSALVVGRFTRERSAALAAGALWYTADVVHIVGHVISSKAADAPMDGVDFGLYPMSVYSNHDVTPQQHIGRSLGGIVASLLAALLLTLLLQAVKAPRARRLLTIAAAQHWLLVLVSLVPLPIVDGGVIYANLAKQRR